MPFQTVSGGLTLQVPTAGTQNWASGALTLAWQKIADHDHTGGGLGTQISAGAIAANAVIGASIRYENNVAARWRNAANTADINGIKVNASNLVEFGANIAAIGLSNNAYLTGRNAAGSADVNLIKINASDRIEFGTTVSAIVLNTALSHLYGGIGTTGVPSNGQLPVGNGAGFTLAAITGTADQITVTNGAGTIALSTPQSIGTASSPTFAGVTAAAFTNSTSTGLVSSAANAAWSPTVTGSGSMTVGSLAQKNTEYLRIGGLMYFRCCLAFTLGGTQSTQINISVPLAGTADNVSTAWSCAAEQGSNAYGVGAREEARWRYDGSNIAVFLTNGASWTLGATLVHIQGSYKITA